MSSPRDSTDQVEAVEKQLLAYLLAETTSPAMVGNILGQLKSYRFQNVEHQVIFECLARRNPRGRSGPGAELPAFLVRAGFPDVDLERFRLAGGMNPEQAAVLCRRLVNRTK